MNVTTNKFIREHLRDNVRQLALKPAPMGVDLLYALQQIAARQILIKKVPSWAQNDQLVFPPHLSLEQCSSEATACYKASLLHGDTCVDLTGGMGIDTYFMSQNFRQMIYIEQQSALAHLTQQNFNILQSTIVVHNMAAEDYLSQMLPVDVLYIDPARRDTHGRKTVLLDDCTPNVVSLQHLLLEKATHVLIKLSPMLDISLLMSELNHIKEVHIVAVDNECKELLCLLERHFRGQTIFRSVNITPQHTQQLVFTVDEEKNSSVTYATSVKQYLYEPNAALLKVGAFKTVAARFLLDKLHVNSHLYTSDVLIENFPGRSFEVINCTPFNKKTGQLLRSTYTQANITIRNFPLSVVLLRQKFQLKDGGDIFLFATTLANNEKVIISCRKP